MPYLLFVVNMVNWKQIATNHGLKLQADALNDIIPRDNIIYTSLIDTDLINMHMLIEQENIDESEQQIILLEHDLLVEKRYKIQPDETNSPNIKGRQKKEIVELTASQIIDLAEMIFEKLKDS